VKRISFLGISPVTMASILCIRIFATFIFSKYVFSSSFALGVKREGVTTFCRLLLFQSIHCNVHVG
jgi:hypothetical protein